MPLTCDALNPGFLRIISLVAAFAWKNLWLAHRLWLAPDVRIAESHGSSRRVLREIERLAREHVEERRHVSDDFCGDADRSSSGNRRERDRRYAHG